MPLPPVLPLLPDWSQGVRETRAFLTSVLTAESGLEQRQQMRSRARRRLTYTARTLDGAVTQAATTVLQSIHEAVCALPWWMHRTTLTADAVIGAGSLSVTTTGLDFLAGNYALLWRSPSRYELVQITAVASGSLTLDAGTPTTLAWQSGDFIIPAFPARLASPLRVTRVAARGLDVAVDAAVEPLSVPVSAGSAGSAPGIFAVTTMPQADNEAESWDRALALVDGQLGPVDAAVFDAAPSVDFPLSLFFPSRGTVQSLWDWYESVLGALTPSWVPNWQQAMTLASDLASGSTAMIIRSMGYTARWFPDESRRHIALVPPPTPIWLGPIHRRTTAAVDNGDGTETLTLNAAPGLTFPAASSLVSVMHYARLVDDAVTMIWQDPDLATVTLNFRELPAEVPASV